MIPELWYAIGILICLSLGLVGATIIHQYCAPSPMDRKELDELRETLGDDSGAATPSNMAGNSRRADAPTQPIHPANFACGECD